jgi:OHCU decarboxylase
VTLDDINALDEDDSAGAFLRCCGSSRWAREMAAARPFASAAALARRADDSWWALDRTDWLEAFAAHLKIGETKAGRSGGSGGVAQADWSQHEQAGVAGAAEETLRRLTDANRDYERRFGYIFIVCATGRTAGEMLSLLESRLRHDAETELRIAAEEQRKISQLRLKKLLELKPDTSP